MSVNSFLEFDTHNQSIFYQCGHVKRMYIFKDILYYRLFSFKDYDVLDIVYENKQGKKKTFRLYADNKKLDVRKFQTFLLQHYISGDLTLLTPRKFRSFLDLKHPFFGPLIIVNLFFFLFLLLLYYQVVQFASNFCKQWQVFGMIFFRNLSYRMQTIYANHQIEIFKKS